MNRGLTSTPTGICGSDLHEYIQGPVVIPTEKRPHPITGASLPVVLCHEFCGRLASVPDGLKGPGGAELKQGMKVMIDPRQNCQACTACVDMRSSNMCPSWGFLGLTGGGGGFTERCAVRANMCYPLPDSLDLANVALIEPLAVGRRALTQSGIAADGWSDKHVLVLGGGPIGFSVLLNLKAFGAKSTYVSEPTALRQEQCQPLATRVFNPMRESVAEECRKLTNGEGVDLVIDCAGVSKPSILPCMLFNDR